MIKLLILGLLLATLCMGLTLSHESSYTILDTKTLIMPDSKVNFRRYSKSIGVLRFPEGYSPCAQAIVQANFGCEGECSSMLPTAKVIRNNERFIKVQFSSMSDIAKEDFKKLKLYFFYDAAACP